MPRSAKLDPLDRFRWRVFIMSPTSGRFIRGGFTDCSSPAVTVSYKEYLEGGRHMNPVLVHERGAFKPITLRRGVIQKTQKNDFAEWMGAAYNVLKGDKTNSFDYRRKIGLLQLNRAGDTVRAWVIEGCVPTFYEGASDFSSLDDSGHSIETITFNYEGFSDVTLNSLSSETDFINEFA